MCNSYVFLLALALMTGPPTCHMLKTRELVNIGHDLQVDMVQLFMLICTRCIECIVICMLSKLYTFAELDFNDDVIIQRMEAVHGAGSERHHVFA